MDQTLFQAGYMKDVTQLLTRIESGDPSATDQLLPLVYSELRRLASAQISREPSGHDLQGTDLVHLAHIRLVDSEQTHDWNSRRHFFSAAATAMRRILVELARAKRNIKSGGQMQRQQLDIEQVQQPRVYPRILAVDEALRELAEKDPPVASLVELRYFGGLTLDQTASVLGISPRTAARYWAYAKAWLYQRIGDTQPD